MRNPEQIRSLTSRDANNQELAGELGQQGLAGFGCHFARRQFGHQLKRFAIFGDAVDQISRTHQFQPQIHRQDHVAGAFFVGLLKQF